MQSSEQAKSEARARRIEGYATWIVDDTGALIDNLAGGPFPHSTTILAEARERVALALSHLDLAIERDKVAHREREHA